jgi:membrane-bound acyltransferase YfiQ involved in biofilm formation
MKIGILLTLIIIYFLGFLFISGFEISNKSFKIKDPITGACIIGIISLLFILSHHSYKKAYEQGVDESIKEIKKKIEKKLEDDIEKEMHL